MNEFAFWKEWDTPLQLVFKTLAILLIGLIATFLIIEWGDLSPFYYWKITGYLENLPFPVFSNHSPFIESTIYTDIPLIFQKVFGASKTLSNSYTYLYLTVLYLGLIGILTLTTFLKNTWYYIAMGLWIILIVLSGIGKLSIFGLSENTTIAITSLLYLSVSYYFNTINNRVSLGYRFLGFVGVLLFIFGFIQLGSSYEEPLLFLARFSYLPALFACLIFILIIGHEIVYAILVLTTPYSKESTSNTTHFMVLTLFYLVNIVLLYLYRIGYIDWDLYYLNEFAIFAISALLGIWGVRARQERYDGVLPFYPYTGLLYLCLAVVTTATLAFQALNANDPFIEAIRNLILYSHIGFGSMFFFYIIGNFINQLKQNLPVHHFAYVEQNFPYISARLAGLIIVAALFFSANYASLYLSVSGYYNGLADLNLSLDKDEVAKYYYQESTGQSRHNHHANFQLAQFEKNQSPRIEYLKKSVKKKPSPFAFASLGKEYENSSQFFDALFTYQKGLKSFPENWALQNNLALLYNKTSVVDSALFYLENNSPGSWKEAVINSNYEAISATHAIALTQKENGDLGRFDLQSNVLANRLVSNDTAALNFITEPQSESLNLFTYGYLKNLGLYCYKNSLPDYLRIIDSYLDKPQNSQFRRELDLVKALNLYQAGRISSAFEIINQLMELDEDETGQWNALLGKWCLELKAPLQASKYFEASREAGYPNETADLARAYNLIGDQSIALYLLGKESQTEDSVNKNQADWVHLFDAIQKNQPVWKLYSFGREEKFLAEIKNTEGDKKIQYEQLGLDNPYFEKGVIASASHFMTVEKDEDTAYRILHQGITINEYSESLIKSYITHCLNTGLIDFAEDALIRLADILPSEAYTAYKVDFEIKKGNAQTKLDQNW